MIQLPPLDDNEFYIREESNGNWFDYKTNQMHISKPPAHNLFANVLTHEMDHFYWHSITPYGLFLDELSIFQFRLFTGYLVNHGIKYPHLSMFYPIYKFVYNREYEKEEVKNQYHNINTLVDSFIKPWGEAVHLEKILEGADTSHILNLNSSDAIKTWNSVEKQIIKGELPPPQQSNGNRLIESSYFPVKGIADDTTLKACPVSKDRWGQSFPVGAFHIFESHAQFIEQTAGVKMKDMINDKKGYRYWYLYIRLVMALKDIGETDIETLIYTFQAFCDIALHIPVGSIYYKLRNENTTYLDLHPGHRFFALLIHLNEFGALKKREETKTYQDKICTYLNWPVISSFHDLILQIEPQDNHEKRQKDAALMRKNNYTCFFYDSNEKELFFHTNAPIVTTGKHGTFLSRSDKDGDKLTQEIAGSVVQLILAKSAWNMMTNKNRFTGIEDYLNNIDLSFAGISKTTFADHIRSLNGFKNLVPEKLHYIL